MKLHPALLQIATECGKPSWDGYQAKPVASSALQIADQLLANMPGHLPVPTVSAEADGQVTFEWYDSPDCLTSLSVAPDGELHYASKIGSSSECGSITYSGAWPTVIVQLASRVAQQ